MQYIHKYLTTSDFNKEWVGSYKKPWVSLNKENEEVKFNKTQNNFLEDFLTFIILESGTVTWYTHYNGYAIWYKKNNDEWTKITSTRSGVGIPVSEGDILQFKGNNNNYWENSFTSTASFKACGNIMSLIRGSDFANITSLTNLAFSPLFQNCTKLVDAENLILPATTLNVRTYYQMFKGCTGLINGPKILTPSLSWDECAYEMFSGCTKLSSLTCLATTVYSGNITNWLYKVSNTGTFTKAPSAIWSTGSSGIPEGWTVIDAE